MDLEEYKNFRNKYLQHQITFLTEENLDKLEDHCRKAICYERGVEHKVVLELLERYKEFLVKLEQNKKRIQELEYMNMATKVKAIENSISKQKVKDLKESIILPNTIVGGRRNGKTLEYGIKLGKIKACEELLEGEE